MASGGRLRHASATRASAQHVPGSTIVPFTFTASGGSRCERLSAALRRLDGLVDWEKRARGGGRMRVDVEPMRDLMARLEEPQRRFRSVHVAGTKGKGSVAALIAHGRTRAGRRVGLYTSPHVERIQERISIAGSPIEDGVLAGVLERALAARELARDSGSPAAAATWFDVLTAAAFLAFADAGLDEVVVECGLGGRLDSTNVLPPGPCVITNIDLEHTAILGATRAAIAREKAGILAPGAWLVSGAGEPDDEAEAAIEEVARDLAVPVLREPARGGTIAERNRRLATRVLEEIAAREGGDSGVAPVLDEDAVAMARLPGRLESCRYGDVEVVLDGAHVAASVDAVLGELLEGRAQVPPVVVLGLGREKDSERILKVLRGRVDRVVCTSLGDGPYRSAEDLCAIAAEVGLTAEAAVPPGAALDRALEIVKPNGWILVTGSLHLVGAVRGLVRPGPASTRC